MSAQSLTFLVATIFLLETCFAFVSNLPSLPLARGASVNQFPITVARSNRRTEIRSTVSDMIQTSVPNLALQAKMKKMLEEAQDFICKAVEEVDGAAKFRQDHWTRENGDVGVTAVMSGGDVWEKAGCNLAVVHGEMPYENFRLADDRMKHNGIDRAHGFKPGDKVPFTAVGLSSVMHPKNPHCPTMHFNYRYFETASGLAWFGGGTDITPAYLDKDDMRHFHSTYKTICDKHDPTFYPRFKKWADDYFVIKHRGETRGLGGIFFDDLYDPANPERIFAFARDCAMAVPNAYLPIIKKHKEDAYNEEQKRWQLLRRGRYVEFNLVYDRGTIFGLKTGLGRVESMLMTLPETARFEYDHKPAPVDHPPFPLRLTLGSPEAEIMDAFKNPREWV